MPHRAEKMALAPLVHAHFKASAILVPDESQRALAGLSLRHRRANHIRFAALAEILTALSQEGVQSLVLKGAALAITVYPRPGLRPMRDMDILVPKDDALHTQKILLELGYKTSIPGSIDEYGGHHLPVAQRTVEGLRISLEVHHRLLPHDSFLYDYNWFSAQATSFFVNDVAAQTLSNEQMLWHIYRHSFAYPTIAQPIRLIWVADFVSLVEKCIDEIDWEWVRRHYPEVWQVLPVFHGLRPWSEKVLNRLNIGVDLPPDGVGVSFQGWPQSSLAEQRRKGAWIFLKDTFWPSEWWTWLYYGTSNRSLKWWWIRFFRHPQHIFSWVLQYLSKNVYQLLSREIE